MLSEVQHQGVAKWKTNKQRKKQKTGKFSSMEVIKECGKHVFMELWGSEYNGASERQERRDR